MRAVVTLIVDPSRSVSPAVAVNVNVAPLSDDTGWLRVDPADVAVVYGYEAGLIVVAPSAFFTVTVHVDVCRAST